MKRSSVPVIAVALLLSLAVVSFSREDGKGSPEEVAVRFARHVWNIESSEAMALVVARQQAKVDWSKVEENRKTVSFASTVQLMKTLNKVFELRKMGSEAIEPDEIEITFDVISRDIEKLSAEQKALLDQLWNIYRNKLIAQDELKERLAELPALEKALADLPLKNEKEPSITFSLVRENGEWRVEAVDYHQAMEFVFFYMETPILFTVKDYNTSAQSAGRNAKIAEEVFYVGNLDFQKYTDQLAELLIWDKNLTDDPGVTFIFGTCTASGYTFTTSHVKGDKPYEFTD